VLKLRNYPIDLNDSNKVQISLETGPEGCWTAAGNYIGTKHELVEAEFAT